jgi:hypothetical protein
MQLMRSASLLLLPVFLYGCQYNAVLYVTVIDKATKEPVAGSKVVDARNNQYLMLAPGEWVFKRWSTGRVVLPLLIETYCGNMYYKLVVVDKWTTSGEASRLAQNPVQFEIDSIKENCR